MPSLEEWIGAKGKLGMFGCGQAKPPPLAALNAGLWHEKFGTVWATNDVRPPKPPRWSLRARSVDWVTKLDGNVVGDAGQISAYTARVLDLARARRGLVFDAGIAGLSKFVTGTGIAHPIENGFAWHRTLGTPYLPGSGVKGLTLALARDWKSLGEADRLSLRRIFGTAPGDTHKGQAKDTEADAFAGTVIFLDAIPVDRPTLTAQILTPHGKGSGAPEDAGQVIPNGFLAVKSGTFRFALLPNPRGERVSAERAIADCRLARKWLQEALTLIGAGAKTKSNYGRFNGFNDVLDQALPATLSAATS